MAKVYCFGNTENGELGLGGIEEEHILSPRKQRLPHDRRKYCLVQLVSGRNHTLLLLRNIAHDQNAVFSCGSNERLQLGRVGSWKKLEVIDALSAHNIIQVACGTNHCLVLSEAGQLFSWGCNLFGQLGLGSREQQEIGKPSLLKKLAVKHIVQISCGGNHCLALTKNGELYAWGSNAFGQLGVGSFGNCISTPTCIMALQWTPIRQIVAGGSHSAILSCTGAIYVWGKNEFGQLGLNDQKNRFLPTLQASLRGQKIAYICLGEEHSAAITTEGGLFTWGAGMYGQLGHGRNTNEILPRKVFELMGNCICQLSCGRCHTLVATDHGRVYSFGLNGSGQLGIGSTQSKYVPNYVSGQWVEINVKDLLLRDGDRSLCPVSALRTINEEVNSNVLSDFKSVAETQIINDSSKLATSDSAMEIDEINDSDNSSCDNDGTSENFIIEEPDDVCARSTNSVPNFLCNDRTVFTNTDHIEIDEYVSDPDSDYEEFPQRKQIVLKQIVASKGDQSFILTQPYSEDVCPKDFRKTQTSSEILKLDNATIEHFKDVPKDSIPSEILDYIEETFCSVACWNASYISDNTTGLDVEKNLKFVKFMSTMGINLDEGSKVYSGLIDWRQAFYGFNMIEDAQNERIAELIYSTVTKILSNMSDLVYKEDKIADLPLDEEVLRVYQLLPLFHLFRMSDTYSESSQQLITSYAKAILALSNSAMKSLQIMWASMPKHYLKNLIHIFKKSIGLNLSKQHEENNDAKSQDPQQTRLINQKIHQNLAICLEVLKLLYFTNKSVEHVSYKEFYIDGISDMFDLKMDYILWKGNRSTARDVKQYYLCNYPFIFDAPAKNWILAIDSEIQQQSAAETSVYQQIMFAQPVHGQIYVNPYLIISVHRNTILQETINQLCLFSKHNEADFKKPLRVYFEGEEAIDAGQGMKKEFFLLLMKEMLDEQYGMFMEYKETNTIWFHHSNFEDDVMYHLVGILCGLAIYNKVIINLPFPLVLYKKLLKESLELDDLAYLDPLLSKNMKEILTSFKKDEFDAIFGEFNFTITLQTFGSAVEFELCPGGKERRLTFENREEYVRLYWQYILETSIQSQFNSFRNGFMKVLDTDILQIFHAEELMQLVSGQEVTDWEELQSVTEYKPPFTKDHPTIRLFWRVFHAFTNEEKKKFLFFLTGSDRIPILGVKALHLVIQPMKVSDEHLPVAHTCFNILDLPQDYKSEDREAKLRSKLLKACEYSKEFALV